MCSQKSHTYVCVPLGPPKILCSLQVAQYNVLPTQKLQSIYRWQPSAAIVGCISQTLTRIRIHIHQIFNRTMFKNSEANCLTHIWSSLYGHQRSCAGFRSHNITFCLGKKLLKHFQLATQAIRDRHRLTNLNNDTFSFYI